jgi:colanic acid/amylovoran biosynthesis glycosyltransferase
MTSQETPISVVHYAHTWLPQTQTWMFNQIRYLPPLIQASIVCEQAINLDQFSLPRTLSLMRDCTLEYIFDKIVQKFGFRRHLGLLVKEAKRFNARILHSHFANFGWINVPAAKRAGLKHVVNFYGYDVNMLPTQFPVWRKRYDELFREADLMLCEGPHMAKCIIALGCPETKIRVHRIGIGVDKIAYKPRVWHSPEPLRVLIAASFQEKKGIPYAIEALAALQKKVPLEITIIGDANSEVTSKREKERIIKKINDYNLQERVRMLGYQPYAVLLQEAYNHHIFLSPSVTAANGDTEGGAPVTLIEMMATGMPIVSTRHCDIPEVIEHQATGLLADERNVDGLVSQLEWLINNHANNGWKKMTDQGRRHVEQNFNVIMQCRRLAEIYQGLLKV